MASTVLVIGSGAREHAVAYTLLKGAAVGTVYCAPGNPGMASDGIRTVRLMDLTMLRLSVLSGLTV